MRSSDLTTLDGLLAVEPDQTSWQWAAEHVDFALNRAYPTEYRGFYDPELIPLWKEPAENVFDPTVREQAILKCSQAGGTENVCLNAIRYAVARQPRRILYVWGDQKAAEDDFRGRIVEGLGCCRETAKKVKQARSVEGRLDFPDMTVAAAWPKNKMAFKRNPWSLIICDEFSTYPGLTPGMIRKRCDTVPFSHIVWISSPDPTIKQASNDDPIFIEYEAGDQRVWMMPDPKTGKLFRYEMGTPTSTAGLKWDPAAKRDDGSWDWQKVRESAHYVTPDGSRIENEDRLRTARTGEWIPTNPEAAADRRSYHVSAFYLPFKSGDFGAVAEAFLRAKRGGPQQLKVFLYEYLAEKWHQQTETTAEGVIGEREAEYSKGEAPSTSPQFANVWLPRDKAIYVTADMQKGHHWWVAREWVDGGDSGLVDWGYGVILEDLREKEQSLGASQVYVDNNYKDRKMEVYEACLEWEWIPTIGSEQLALPYKQGVVDPFEGKYGAGESSILQVTFHTDIFKSLLLGLIRNESEKAWVVYRGIEGRYCKQVASEERVDGKWATKRGHPDNHLWDCEVLQILAATIEGMHHANIFTHPER